MHEAQEGEDDIPDSCGRGGRLEDWRIGSGTRAVEEDAVSQAADNKI